MALDATQRKEIERLIELQKQKEQADKDKKVFDTKLTEELNALLLKHATFAKKTAQEIQEALDKALNPQTMTVESIHKKSILAAYDEKYMTEDNKTKYKPGYGAQEKNGKFALQFPEPKEASVFFAEQAKLNRKFVVIDANSGLVLAYSNGNDGKLYGTDHKEFSVGTDPFKQTVKGEKFDPLSWKMPEPEPVQEASSPSTGPSI